MKGKKAILFSGSHLLRKGVGEEACGYILRRREMGAVFARGMKPEAYFIFFGKLTELQKVDKNDDISKVRFSLWIRKVWIYLTSFQYSLCYVWILVFIPQESRTEKFLWGLLFYLWFFIVRWCYLLSLLFSLGVNRPHLTSIVNERWLQLYSFRKKIQKAKCIV